MHLFAKFKKLGRNINSKSWTKIKVDVHSGTFDGEMLKYNNVSKRVL